MNYPIRDVLEVVRVIRDIVLDNPELLNTEGVFRISATQTQVEQLINDLLVHPLRPNKVDFIRGKKYDIHEYIGALKKVFRECEDIDPKLYASLKELAKADANNLDSFFEELISTKNIDNIYYAEILYSVFQIMAATKPYEKKTKMTADNLGIVIGPNICSDADRINIEVINLFKQLSANIITANPYDPKIPFNKYIESNKPKVHPLIRETSQHELDAKTKQAQDKNLFIGKLEIQIKQMQTEVDQLDEKVKIVDSNIQQLQKQMGHKGINKKDTQSTIKGMEKEKRQLSETKHTKEVQLSELKNNLQKLNSMQHQDAKRVYDLKSSLTMFSSSGAAEVSSGAAPTNSAAAQKDTSDNNDDNNAPEASGPPK